MTSSGEVKSQGADHPRLVIDSCPKPRKSSREREILKMRSLLMAPFAFDFPGHNANHWAGRVGASARSTKTTAKTTAKTV